MEIDIKALLRTLMIHKSSDLHLIVNSEPTIRVDGKLKALDLPILTGEKMKKMCYAIITEKQKKEFEENGELDFALELKDIGRFRVNFYKTLEEVSAAFRVIPTKIPSLEDLNAPEVYNKLIKREKGLILVTGPTGSGKSTTLAAMLNEINENESKHIITIEDPIEFLHTNKRSFFSFREVGRDTKSFASALKYSLRQDPDIILIGEMRDKETISAALTAAETGHLVFATLHTNSAPGTINRIIDVFAGEEQEQIRTQLASSLVAIISQVLVPKTTSGRLAVSEILVNNNAIANLIRSDKGHQIYSQMELNYKETGMQTQLKTMVKHVEKKDISEEDAIQYANDQLELKRQIKEIK